ncbi:MAG: phosphoribosylamine--glycine ligase [Pseudobdellovibrionaceae bacterium]
MKVLVLGNGAREHALAWKVLQSDKVQDLIFCPENPAAVVQLQNEFAKKSISAWNLPVKTEQDLIAIAEKSKSEKIDLVVVGPDNLLALGAVDILHKHGLQAFGPTQSAARIESSKAFAKQIMQKSKVSTATFFTAQSLAAALDYVKKYPWQQKPTLVIKADGLALGKGVEICHGSDQAEQAIHRLCKISDTLILEEFLSGYELSVFALCDGEDFRILPAAQDYKKITQDPNSPNTGGMGAYAPATISPQLLADLQEKVFAPILKTMKEQGCPFSGLLYAGLMIGENQFWVLEFNSRFGDPETQALMPLLNVDLVDWLLACCQKKIKTLPTQITVHSGASVYVVAASPGYPEAPQTGSSIFGIEKWFGQHQGFFAGVKKSSEGPWQTSGGRVLGALGLGESVQAARQQAYQRLEQIQFDGMQFRSDIAKGKRL